MPTAWRPGSALERTWGASLRSSGARLFDAIRHALDGAKQGTYEITAEITAIVPWDAASRTKTLPQPAATERSPRGRCRTLMTKLWRPLDAIWPSATHWLSADFLK